MTMVTAWLAAALLMGCSEKDPVETDDSAPPADTAPDPTTVPLAGACDLADDYGGFSITVATDSSNIAGTVADGVVPAAVLEEIGAEGDCRLLRRNNPFCEPSCAAGETCDFDGNCLPYPSNQDLGTVTISGLAADSTMTPVFPGNTYYDTSMTHPAFLGGELITLTMPGGVYGPLELYGVGVEMLDTTGTEWVIEPGADLTITWPAPTLAVVRSTVEVRISIDQHGTTPGTLYCSFADDGEGTVPGGILAALESAGVTGFPSGAIERRTADRGAAGSGCLDFIVSSPGTVTVDVLGHTPCISDPDCPEGQTCDETLQICG